MNYYFTVIAIFKKDEYQNKLKTLAAHNIFKNDNKINYNSNLYKSAGAKLALNKFQS